MSLDKNYQEINGGFVPYPIDTQLPKQDDPEYPQIETESKEPKESEIIEG
jgi:hypothetical protein